MRLCLTLTFWDIIGHMRSNNWRGFYSNLSFWPCEVSQGLFLALKSMGFHLNYLNDVYGQIEIQSYHQMAVEKPAASAFVLLCRNHLMVLCHSKMLRFIKLIFFWVKMNKLQILEIQHKTHSCSCSLDTSVGQICDRFHPMTFVTSF